MYLIKVILIVFGTLSLIVGIAGIVIPGLPTVPFILLAAGLYIKSSDKLYQKLIGNKIIGSYVTEYRNKKGMTKKSKLTAIGIMWGMIAISCIFIITAFSLKHVVAVIGVIGTIVIVFIIPTITSDRNNH